MAKSIVEMKSEAYDITLKMGNLQNEFNKLNEQLTQLKSKIEEAEKKPQ